MKKMIEILKLYKFATLMAILAMGWMVYIAATEVAGFDINVWFPLFIVGVPGVWLLIAVMTIWAPSPQN